MSNALQSNPAAWCMIAGQRWHCSEPGLSFCMPALWFWVTWIQLAKGCQLVQVTTVGMGVQGQAKFFLRHLQLSINISLSILQLLARRTSFQSLSFVEVGSELSFCIFHKFGITESKRGAEWRLSGRNSCTPSQSCHCFYSPVILACVS